MGWISVFLSPLKCCSLNILVLLYYPLLFYVISYNQRIFIFSYIFRFAEHSRHISQLIQSFSMCCFFFFYPHTCKVNVWLYELTTRLRRILTIICLLLWCGSRYKYELWSNNRALLLCFIGSNTVVIVSCPGLNSITNTVPNDSRRQTGGFEVDEHRRN